MPLNFVLRLLSALTGALAGLIYVAAMGVFCLVLWAYVLARLLFELPGVIVESVKKEKE